jgi:hypothetical protein
MKVFVSYTLRDSIINRHVLTTIEQALSTVSAPYIDLLHNRGPNHQAGVFAALHESSLVLACITPGFSRSPWVRLEIETARHRGTPIVPLMLSRFRGGSRDDVGFRARPRPTGWPVQTPRSTESRFADSDAAQSSESDLGASCGDPVGGMKFVEVVPAGLALLAGSYFRRAPSTLGTLGVSAPAKVLELGALMSRRAGIAEVCDAARPTVSPG